MAYEHKEGQGSLFQNEKQNDRQPDYRGTIVIEGKTYEIAAWAKTSQRGTKYLSLHASQPKDCNSASLPQTSYPSPNQLTTNNKNQGCPTEDDGEDLPF